MALLGFCQGFEPICDFVKTFVARRTRHARIHIRVFVGFASDRRFQIVGSTADRLARGGIAGFFKILQMAMSVAGLAFRSRPENSGDIVVTFDIRLLGEIQIAAVRLALAGESGFEVLFGFRAF